MWGELWVEMCRGAEDKEGWEEEKSREKGPKKGQQLVMGWRERSKMEGKEKEKRREKETGSKKCNARVVLL